MNLQYSADQLAFRSEIRDFVVANLPEDIAHHQRQGFQISRQMQARWVKILDAKGWSVPGWDVEFGGPGWTAIEQHIFSVECALADAPDAFVSGISLVGPVIQRFGSREMQEYYLPRIRSGDLAFCQGFSEPQAGSDLANLQTVADPDGDDFIVNGSKIWTTGAHEADDIFCLVRTDRTVRKPQTGISMLLFPLNTPGVTISPITSIDDCHHLNQVFFEDVRVSRSSLVGELNKGWDYTKFLLDHEKTYNAHIGLLKRFVSRTRELAELAEAHSGRTVLTPAFKQRLARLTIEVEALEWSVLRALHMSDQGQSLGSVAPALKIRGSDLLLRFSELQLEALGPQVVPAYSESDLHRSDLPADASASAPGVMAQTIYWRASSVFGGSNDIQRSVMWNMALRS